MTVATTTTGDRRLNPTLVVTAFFLASVDGEVRRTQFRLIDHPDVTQWLGSFLDFLLYQQGKLPGERRIAEPPGGATRQALIDGGVIIAAQRPDGGLALRLNTALEIGLLLKARRRGQPAVESHLALGADPELTRWLLDYGLAGGRVPDRGPLSESLTDSLCRHAVLVDELPAEPACLPDPAAAPGDPTVVLAPMSRLIFQEAGQDIPVEVRTLLGRHEPGLPPGRALVWGRDAGSGLFFPALWPPGCSRTEVERMAGAGASQRAAWWSQQVEVERASLALRRYAVLREILPAAQRQQMRHFVRELVARGYFPPPGDGQVAQRAAIHNQPTVACIHHGLAAIVSSIAPEPVKASYCYLGCYEAGSVLERHKDRPQCVYNLSLVLDMQGPDGEPPPWPIYLELDGQPEAVLLQVGDGLLYSGTDIWHWREALPAGQRAIVCFYHFVPGDYSGSLD